MTGTPGRYRALLVDFFGTVVDYDPSRVPAVSPATERFCRANGIDLTTKEAIGVWESSFAELDAATAETMREYSMVEVGTLALRSLLGTEPTRYQAQEGAEAYLADWGRAITPIAGMADALTRLGAAGRLVVVSNTHGPGLVQRTLGALGVEHLVDDVVTSVEVGWRKPHPAIFSAALQAAGAAAAECLFVGDSKGNDYDGPRAAGIPAVLVSPTSVAGVPEAHRIASLVDLPGRLGF